MVYFTNNKDKFLRNACCNRQTIHCLFATDTELSASEAANKYNVVANLYGNIVGTKGAGGTGKCIR